MSQRYATHLNSVSNQALCVPYLTTVFHSARLWLHCGMWLWVWEPFQERMWLLHPTEKFLLPFFLLHTQIQPCTAPSIRLQKGRPITRSSRIVVDSKELSQNRYVVLLGKCVVGCEYLCAQVFLGSPLSVSKCNRCHAVFNARWLQRNLRAIKKSVAIAGNAWGPFLKSPWNQNSHKKFWGF